MKVLLIQIGKAPKTVNTYVNRPTTLSFDEADTIAETESLSLSYTPPSTTAAGAAAAAESSSSCLETLVPLRFVKYQNVHSLTLFIKDNVGGGDVTAVSRVVLYGSSVETTKSLSELKANAEG
jgi:hypothetical protein